MSNKKLMSYEQAAHAMQSGVAMLMNYEAKDTEPKHLRVGVNAGLCDNSALAKLLIAKGIITEQEYMAAITEEMNEEVTRYEALLESIIGKKVTLL